MPFRWCFTRICCPRSLLHILIEIRLTSRTACSHLTLFPLQKNRYALANCGLLQYSPPLKIGSLKRNVWQFWAAKFGQCCGETTARVGRAWRRPLPMAEAIAIISQATILACY
jgi:hypothetical protein